MLIDSNILVYSINKRSPKHQKAQSFLRNKDNLKLYVAQQNIFETLRILTHPKFEYPMLPVNAIKAVNLIVDSCKVIGPDYKTHLIAFELINNYNLSSNLIFDAYLAATAISNGVIEIATDNEKDFKKFGIKVYNPFKE